MRTSTLELMRRHDHGVLVLTLSGRLDLPGATAVLAAASAESEAGGRAVGFDLAGLEEPAAPRLLTVFPAAQRRLRSWPEHEVHLSGASPSVTRLLQRLNIDSFVSVHVDRQQAVASAQAAQRAVHRRLRLVASASSVGQARRGVDELLGSVPVGVRNTAELVTSELATNALRHVHEPFTVSLALNDAELLVAVTDHSRRLPRRRPMSLESEGGRGLYLVDRLCASWGVRLIHKDGKAVWARLAPPAT
jgi:anti-sigma regulatory factor (Ser/Thr protein kinase)/anti-anti-sigma regulatory factor